MSDSTRSDQLSSVIRGLQDAATKQRSQKYEEGMNVVMFIAEIPPQRNSLQASCPLPDLRGISVTRHRVARTARYAVSLVTK